MAKITKTYDLPATPYQRVLADTGTVKKTVKTKLTREDKPLNPAAIQRQIQSFAGKLLTLTTAKQGPKNQASLRVLSNDSTKKGPRAS